MGSPYHTILVPRLARFYDAALALGLEGLTLDLVKGATPVSEFTEDERVRDSTAWHLGRIHHFLLQLQAGVLLDPIEVDNECLPPAWIGPPCIQDGHHRFLAALLDQSPTIRISYGGRVDSLRYMEGKRKTIPADLA